MHIAIAVGELFTNRFVWNLLIIDFDITRGDFKEKVWPLAASELIYVGRATERKLSNYGIHTVGQLAAVPPDILQGWFGINGLKLWAYANGADKSRVMHTFANQQKYVKPLLPYDIFVANLEAGNDKQLMIKALVESLDLTIGPTKALGTICAVSSLEEIYDKHGYHVLERTLMLCIGAWEGEQNSLSANMLKGVCRLVVAYGDSMRDDMFVEKVGRFSAKDISRTAKERRAGSLGYAEAMLLAYNRKMRYPLRWGKLYNKKGTEDMGPDVETDMEPDDSEDD